jgi:hypothetical protein
MVYNKVLKLSCFFKYEEEEDQQPAYAALNDGELGQY